MSPEIVVKCVGLYLRKRSCVNVGPYRRRRESVAKYVGLYLQRRESVVKYVGLYRRRRESVVKYVGLRVFGSLGSISQKGLLGVPPTTAKKWSVLNKIVVQERPFFAACQNLVFGWFAGWLASDVWKYEKMRQSFGLARFCWSETRRCRKIRGSLWVET